MTNSYQGNPMKENDADIWDDMVEKIYEPTETTGPGHPSSTTINQTLESCQQGEMKRMSCTDKLTSWNVLGFQGSLINVLLEAIYVPLIVLANEDDQSEYLQWTTHSKFASEFSSAAFD
ncbi:MAG: adenosine deaminase domain containing 1, partial [Marteilia pararefringens]